MALVIGVIERAMSAKPKSSPNGPFTDVFFGEKPWLIIRCPETSSTSTSVFSVSCALAI